MSVAELLVGTLAAANVRRASGSVGDSLDGRTEAPRASGAIAWVGVRHEETAAFAAASAPLMRPAKTLKWSAAHALGGKEHVACDNPKGFDLCVMQAVMNGRGARALDLARAKLPG